MMVAILSIAAALLGFAIKFYWARRAEVSDPVEQRKKASEQIAKEIITDDEAAANRRLDDWIRIARLRNAAKSNQRGSNNPPSESEPSDKG